MQVASGLPGAVAELCGSCSAAPPSSRALLGLADALGPALGLGDPVQALEAAAAAADPLVLAPMRLGAAPAAVVVGGVPAAVPGAAAPQQPASQHGQQHGGDDAGEGEKLRYASGGTKVPPYADSLAREPPVGAVMAALEAAWQRGLLPATPGRPPGGSSAVGDLGTGGGVQGGLPGSKADVQRALGAVWSLGVSALQLGLADTACLALCALTLQCSVRLAVGGCRGLGALGISVLSYAAAVPRRKRGKATHFHPSDGQSQGHPAC